MCEFGSSSAEQAVMGLRLEADPALVSRGEVRREIGDRVAVADTLAYVACMGLAHELGGCLWATRAAVVADELIR